MKKLIMALLLTGCAATHYEKIKTVDEAVNDPDDIKNGLVLTKKGAVVDLQAKDVNGIILDLRAQNEDLSKKVKFLEEENLKLKLNAPTPKPEIAKKEEKPAEKDDGIDRTPVKHDGGPELGPNK